MKNSYSGPVESGGEGPGPVLYGTELNSYFWNGGVWHGGVRPGIARQGKELNSFSRWRGARFAYARSGRVMCGMELNHIHLASLCKVRSGGVWPVWKGEVKYGKVSKLNSYFGYVKRGKLRRDTVMCSKVRRGIGKEIKLYSCLWSGDGPAGKVEFGSVWYGSVRVLSSINPKAKVFKLKEITKCA